MWWSVARRASRPGSGHRRGDGQPGRPPPGVGFLVGGVLISSDTYRHVRLVLVPVRSGSQLKGISHLVDAFEVLNERPRGFRLDAARGVEGVETRTVGREPELRQLQDRLGGREDGRWRVITIVGDAGVGKSRCSASPDRWLAEMPEPVWWFRGRASPSGENRPNALLREVIVSRLEIQESDGRGRARSGRRASTGCSARVPKACAKRGSSVMAGLRSGREPGVAVRRRVVTTRSSCATRR